MWIITKIKRFFCNHENKVMVDDYMWDIYDCPSCGKKDV